MRVGGRVRRWLRVGGRGGGRVRRWLRLVEEEEEVGERGNTRERMFSCP